MPTPVTVASHVKILAESEQLHQDTGQCGMVQLCRWHPALLPYICWGGGYPSRLLCRRHCLLCCIHDPHIFEGLLCRQ